MFFAKAGKYKACGIFSIQHFILIILTITGVKLGLKITMHKNKEEVRNLIKNCTIIMWILETIKITFSLTQASLKDINAYVPLYYCSLLLYAGLFSSFATGKLKRTGDVFLATGGIIGGLVFILFPTTSLPTYPMMHFITLHSFIYHGVMLYLGLLVNLTEYIELEKKDILYYAELVGIVCIMAFVVNNIFGSNLMFISQDFPGTPLQIIYKITGKLYTSVMILGQMTLPFILIYKIREYKKRILLKVIY